MSGTEAEAGKLGGGMEEEPFEKFEVEPFDSMREELRKPEGPGPEAEETLAPVLVRRALGAVGTPSISTLDEPEPLRSL